jgi:glycosyltransferase involved in cell wall biosynthesis
LESLRAQAQAKSLPATFLGFVNVDRLPEVYCAADILLHAAEQDPHPLVLSEAACVGLPLVVSDRVGAVGRTDIVRDLENAIVYPCGNVSALANAIRRLGRDPETLARMAEASLRIFDELDIRKSVAGVLDAVRACVMQRRDK